MDEKHKKLSSYEVYYDKFELIFMREREREREREIERERERERERTNESKSEREREGENLAAGNKSVMEVSSWMQ